MNEYEMRAIEREIDRTKKLIEESEEKEDLFVEVAVGKGDPHNIKILATDYIARLQANIKHNIGRA